MGINECHIVPKNQEAWWSVNSMRRYTLNTDGTSKDVANLALLRVDIHQVFDRHKFAIVPKPYASQSSPSPRALGSGSFALAAHVLETDHEAREFCSLYHNVAIAQAGVDVLSREFLFARFAWAIFAHLQTFLNSTITRRHLAILVRNENGHHSVLKQMDGPEWIRYLAVRGQARSGSKTRKRSSSQVTQDGDDGPVSDDAYRERWIRRSCSLDSTHSDGDLDPEMRQIRENTRWYNEVGQFSQGDLEQEDLDRNTRWYDEVGQFSRAGLSDGEELSTDGSDYDSNPRYGRRPRRQTRLGYSPPSLRGMPQLSHSLTTQGSVRRRSISSSLTDLSGCEENEADRGVHPDGAALRDKIPGAVDRPTHIHGAFDDREIP